MPVPTTKEAEAAHAAAIDAQRSVRLDYERQLAEFQTRHAAATTAAHIAAVRTNRIRRLACMDPHTRAALLADRPVGGARVWTSHSRDWPDLAHGRGWTSEGQILRALLRELEATDATNP